MSDTSRISTAKSWMSDKFWYLVVVGGFFFVLVLGWPAFYPNLVNGIIVPLANTLKQVPVIADVIIWFETTRGSEGPVFVGVFIGFVAASVINWLWGRRQAVKETVKEKAEATAEKVTEKVSTQTKATTDAVSASKDETIKALETRLAELEKKTAEQTASEG